MYMYDIAYKSATGGADGVVLVVAKVTFVNADSRLVALETSRTESPL